MPVVRVPDGRLVRFPDDMPNDEIKGIISAKFPDAYGEGETSLLGYVPETLKAIGAGGAGMIESALTGASFLLPEETEQAARRKIAEIGGGVQEFLAPDQAYEGTYLDLMRGVGSTLPFLAAAPFGIPGVIAGATMGVGAGAGEAAQRAEAAGATEEEISTAAGYGMIPGATEMIAPARIIGRARRVLGPRTEEIADALNNSFKDRLIRISEGKLGRVSKAAMEEAAQEASSEVLQNLIAQGVYDPNTGTFEGVGESAKIGGGVGGIVQFFTDLIIPGRPRGGAPAPPPPETTPPAPTEPRPDQRPPSIEGGLFGGQELATVFDADIMEEIGFDLGKPTAEKLFALDLADPTQRAEAEAILRKYVNNPLVRNTKPQVVSRIRPILDSPIFRREEEAGAVAPVRAPAEMQPDMVDIAEQQQLQELMDEEELARMQVEEDARLAEEAVAQQEAQASRAAAEAEVAAVQQEMDIGEADRRVAERRQQESVDKRRQVLLPIIERGDITDVENLTRAFSAELGRQGFTDTTPTPDELAAITRRSYELEQAAGEATAQAEEQAAAEARLAEEQRAGAAEIEALVPEREVVTPAAPPTEQELQQAEKARLNREKLERTGRGLEGQLEIPAIERPERVTAPVAESEAAVEEAPKVQKANKVFFDRLNVAPAAPIRKRTQGMDVNSPEFRAELTAFAGNARVPEQTKINVNNFLQATPEAAAQMDLFGPAKPRETIYERDLRLRREERAAKKAAEETTAAPVAVDEGETITIPTGKNAKVTQSVPRYWYHSLRGRELGAEGQILPYSRGKETEQLLKEGFRQAPAGAVYLSPTPFDSDSVRIDASKLDPALMRTTGQVEGNAIYAGEIPASAIVQPQKSTTAPAATTTAPAATTTAPAATTTAPAAKTTAPAAKTTAPAVTTTAPAAKTTAPAAKTTAPAVTTPTPPAKTKTQTLVEKVRAFKLNKNNLYTQAGAAKHYLDIADGDVDVALREVAFDSVKPKESTIKAVTDMRRAAAARKWVEKNLPESTTELEKLTKQAQNDEIRRVEGDLYRSPKKGKDSVQKRRERQKADKALINSYVNPEENPDNNDTLTQEAVNTIIDFENGVQEAQEVSRAEDKQAIREALELDMAAFEGDITQLLEADAVAATISNADQSVVDEVNEGNIGTALTQIFKTSPNSRVRAAANALASTIKNVTVETVNELNDAKGRPIAAIYDPKTNKIIINNSVPLSTHAVLHEAAHAVTHETLKNKSHPATTALTKLYNDLKGAMPDEYGMRSLGEFVAEAFTNPEFQAKLAAYKPTGQKMTGWERFWNAVRKLFGFKDESADAEAIRHINTILATQPNTRNVTDVPNALAHGNPDAATTHLMSGGKKFVKGTSAKVSDILEWGGLASGRARAFFLNGVGLEAITDLIGSKIPSAKTVEKLLYQVEGVRVEYMKKYNNLLNDAYKVLKDGKAKDIFNKLVSFSTINRIDPTVDEDKIRKYWVVYGTYDSKTDKRTRKEEKFDTKAQMEKRVAQLEAQREADTTAGRPPSIVGKVIPKEPNPQRTADYEEVVKLFKQLTPEQRGIYIRLRDFYSDLNDKIIAAEEANIEKLETEEGVKKTIRDEMFMRRLESGFIEPYFPLTRSGTYWLEFNYRDENGQIVYATGSYDSWLQRRRAMNKLKELPDSLIEKGSLRAKSRKEIERRVYNNQVPLPFLTDLRKKINAIKIEESVEKLVADKKITKQEAKAIVEEGKRQVNEFLADVMLRSLPEQALVQSRRVRQNIAFFEGDALESFQQKAPMFIKSYANLEHVVDLEIAGNKVRAERDALGEENSFIYDAATIVAGTPEETRDLPVMGGLPSYTQFAKNPHIPNIFRVARSATFLWTLGGNISSIVVNASIIPIVLQARLAAKYGPINATRSTALAGALYVSTFGTVSREGMTEVDEQGKPIKQADMLKELGGFSLTNDIDPKTQLGKVLAKFDKLSNKFVEYGWDARSTGMETADMDNPNSTLLTKFVYWSGFLFNHSERAIKQTSAMSTYMLEMEKLTGKSFGKITEAEFNKFGEQVAQEAINTTLWVNSSATLTTAPRIAQNKVGSLIWQFKRVPGQFMYTHLRMVKTLFDDMTGKARTAEEIEEARILRNMFFYLSATGGALAGVKGIPLYGAVAAIANMFLDDDEDDFNTMIAKMIGEDKYYGLIASQLGIDLTDRISLTNLMIRDRGNYRPTNETEALIEAWAGPVYGVSRRFYDGLEALLDDNPRNKDRAFEALLPTGASNIAKAYRFATKGYETGRGDAIISEELPAGDIFKQALGFSPISTRAARDRLSLNIRKETGRKERRSGILDKISYAVDPKSPKPELLQEALKEVMAYNRDHPYTAIDYEVIKRSLRSRATRSNLATLTGGMPISDKKVLMEILESDAEFEDTSDWLDIDL